MAIVAPIASITAIVVMMILLFVLIKKMSSRSKSEPWIKTKRRRFTYSDVLEMTKNLQKPLGEGGLGIVYHGNLNGSEKVAIKLLSQTSAQGYKEFKAEVELVLRVHHINLVSVVGYCNEKDHFALIYEYMSNGDLHHHLSGKHVVSILDWGIRLQIAMEAALGLEYLHIGCKPAKVHRDVKSTNILLDDKFKAKIADFGLSRSFQVGGDQSRVSTVVAGTLGYFDPENYLTSELFEKSDIYSFGILLLEIITNQLVIDQTRKMINIAEWVTYVIKKGDTSQIVDPKLQGNYEPRSVWRALEVAMSCANPSSTKRPNMSQVIIILKECLESENTRISRPWRRALPLLCRWEPLARDLARNRCLLCREPRRLQSSRAPSPSSTGDGCATPAPELGVSRSGMDRILALKRRFLLLAVLRAWFSSRREVPDSAKDVTVPALEEVTKVSVILTTDICDKKAEKKSSPSPTRKEERRGGEAFEVESQWGIGCNDCDKSDLEDLDDDDDDGGLLPQRNFSDRYTTTDLMSPRLRLQTFGFSSLDAQKLAP
ncbi:hypothetical protein Bca4012_026450 [Brassica carinata]